MENLLFWLDVETFRYSESDENILLVIARRIFLNYISSDGQLQINLSSEIRFVFLLPLFPQPSFIFPCLLSSKRNAIVWPALGVSRNIFDDSQLHVYAMMKGHTFRRFEKSTKGAELKAAITSSTNSFLFTPF